MGDPSSLPRTTSLLEILGSVTVSMVDMYGGHNVGSIWFELIVVILGQVFVFRIFVMNENPFQIEGKGIV